MERKVQQIRWTEKASEALEDVYAFYIEKSESVAVKVVGEIIEKAESITFPEQYQSDEIDPHCRRIFVRDYKILYQVEGKTVYIINILCTKKSAI